MELPTTTNPTLEEAKAFVDRLNADGEVTPAKRQGWDLVSAYSVLDDKMGQGSPFDEQTIKDFQGLITRHSPQLQMAERGNYSYVPKEILGVAWKCKSFADPSDIDPRMKRLAHYLDAYMKFKPEDPSQAHKVIDHAAEIMVDFIDIHPFADGNGRTSRLLADGILIYGGLYPMPHWLNPNTPDSSKSKQNFNMMMEYAAWDIIHFC